MAAVMLAGAPLCNEAFANNVAYKPASGSPAAVADVKLENGVKFILLNSNVRVKAASVTTADKKTYMVESTNASAKEATFEVVNVQKSALGITFGLKVDGKTFAHKSTSNNYCTIFSVAADETTLGAITGFTAYLEDGTDFESAFRGYNVATTNKDYTADDLKEVNQSSTSFSFGADAVEGNIFQGLTPLKFNEGTLVGTIFVKGSADDIKKLKWNQKETAAKVTVAYVKNETWGLNTSAEENGEGYKLVMINGAEFFAEKDKANWENAVFTNIIEADQLNNEGEIDLTISPIVGKNTSGTQVNIAAVKTSASDTKTYVTTVATSGTKYAKVIKPTLGDNTYFAASEFLSTGKSVYNVYFTSGKESVANKLTTEYHKYMAVTSNGTDFQADALAANDVQLNSPFAQWIATGFDGKYTLTLTNRQTMQNVVLKLNATKTAGVYKIVSTSGSTYTQLPNLTDLAETTDNEKDLVGKEIKLVKTTVTKTDGYLDLTEEEMAAKVAFKFSGKSAELGKTSFVAAAQYDNGTKLSSIYPTQDENKIARFGIAKADVEILNKISYAYLNENNQVVADAVDTLQVPVYNISYTYTKKGNTDPTVAYVKNRKFELDEAATPEMFIFPKAMNGSYTMTKLATSTTPSDFNAGRYATNIVKGSTINFDESGSAFAPEAKEFSYLTVILNDNKDRTSLEAASRHATFEAVNVAGAVSFQENKKGILEGIIAAEPATFWLDTLTNGDEVSFYISKGIKAAAEETKADEAAAMRNFMYYANDSLNIFNEGSALATQNKNYLLEGTDSDVKAIFRPATLAAHDTLTTVVDGKEVTVVTKDADAAKAQVDGLKSFQYGIVLADEEVAGEYVIYSKANPAMFLYNLNGKLGFTTDERKALIVKLGEGDATANEAIAAENVAVIAGEGVVTVKGAAGKQVVVSNILGQVIANKVATSDEETIAVAAGVAVVVVDGEATKVVVK